MRYFSAHDMPTREMEKEIVKGLWQRRSFFGVARDAMKLLQGMGL